jgi:hypothetical protein
MKLNFWQWLGVVLLIIGVAVFIWDKRRTQPEPLPGAAAPATQP